MKKPHVLNRAMFNQGGTSAYGRGITSNLVSDEQRQRFNSGGRVGLYNGGDFFPPINKLFLSESDYGRGQPWREHLYRPDADRIADANRAQWEQRFNPFKSRKTAAELYAPKTEEEAIQEDVIREGGDTEVFDQSELETAGKRIADREPAALPIDTKSDELGVDWATFADKLYDKKSAKGEAQLGLAGNVLAAAFQPKKEAMAILGKGLGDFGKTATQRKKKMEDIAATGKMYETIYKSREETKGKETRKSAEEAAAIKAAPDKASDIFHAVLDKKATGTGGAKSLKDADWAYALQAATASPVDTATREDIPNIEGNADLPEVKNKTYVIEGKYYKIGKTGRLEDITEEILVKFKRT